MKATPERWLLLGLTVAVSILVYFHFTQKRQVEYRTPAIYAPAWSSSSASPDPAGSLQEIREKRRLDERIDCLAAQARSRQNSDRMAPIPC